MNRSPRDYTAYGLHVRSPVALPFALLPNPPHGEPDVTIRIGKTPEALHLPAWRSQRRETAPGALLQNVDGSTPPCSFSTSDREGRPHAGA